MNIYFIIRREIFTQFLKILSTHYITFHFGIFENFLLHIVRYILRNYNLSDKIRQQRDTKPFILLFNIKITGKAQTVNKLFCGEDIRIMFIIYMDYKDRFCENKRNCLFATSKADAHIISAKGLTGRYKMLFQAVLLLG